MDLYVKVPILFLRWAGELMKNNYQKIATWTLSNLLTQTLFTSINREWTSQLKHGAQLLALNLDT
jgi:hypothetical protein